MPVVVYACCRVLVADIAACGTSQTQCPQHAVCLVRAGVAECMCEAGYSGDGERCVDVNECVVSGAGSGVGHHCHKFAACSNYDGGYSCWCQEGFRGDGRSCEGEGRAVIG